MLMSEQRELLPSISANQSNAESMSKDKRKQLQFVACVPACLHTLVKIKNWFHFKISVQLLHGPLHAHLPDFTGLMW